MSGRGAIMFTNSKQLKVSERKDAFEHGYSDLDTPTPSEKVSQWHRDIFLTTPAGIGESEVEQQVHPRQCVCDSCMTEYGTYKFYNNMMTKSFSEVDKTQEKGPQKEKSNIMVMKVVQLAFLLLMRTNLSEQTLSIIASYTYIRHRFSRVRLREHEE